MQDDFLTGNISVKDADICCFHNWLGKGCCGEAQRNLLAVRHGQGKLLHTCPGVDRIGYIVNGKGMPSTKGYGGMSGQMGKGFKRVAPEDMGLGIGNQNKEKNNGGFENRFHGDLPYE
ncbi:MAG: hypothetical protein CSA26_05880 [Desulfobacterales bacterium]|nr:MAG: hypothetical protein CSA26_05880 [Desulfobacterales bacterium]